MNITITGRHISVSDNLKDYAEKKIIKLEKYFHQLIDAHIIMYVEKLDHGAEVIINGDGIQFHGREKAADLYSAIDLLFEKMEKQVSRYKEKHQAHKGPKNDGFVYFDLDEMGEGIDVRLNQVSNKPIDRVEAYLQMKNDENDFILFKQGVKDMKSSVDYSNKCYAALYRNNDAVKMVEIPFENITEHKFEHDTFVEYDLEVKSDSLSNPKIKFVKSKDNSIQAMTLQEAMKELEQNNSPFVTFFNSESQYFNVIYRNGKDCEVMVPAF